MEDVNITINNAGQRIVICPICEEELHLADDELVGDIVMCELCNTALKLID